MNEETSEESEEMRHRMETKGRIQSLLIIIKEEGTTKNEFVVVTDRRGGEDRRGEDNREEENARQGSASRRDSRRSGDKG